MLALNRTYLGPTLLADELARAGVRHVCIAPGSRSAPLALTLGRHPVLRAWSHVDERSAGFFALGLAKASRTPVALVCTSGTAAANFLPAVVEAWHARVPLVVLTADRPPELRDCGAGQTIDQLRLFGAHVRWFVEVGTPEATPDAVRWLRTLACRAVATAAGPPAGPVHLNLPFREPLVPAPVAPHLAAGGRDRAPFTRVHATSAAAAPAAIGVVAAALAAARRPLVVCGPLDDPDPTLADAVAALARALGAPVLAEPTSNLRRAVLAPALVDAADAILREPRFVDADLPDAVVRIGAPPTSKSVAALLARVDGAVQIVIDATDGWPEPAGVASHLLRATPAGACSALAAALRHGRAAPDWAARWRRAGSAARCALTQAAAAGEPSCEAHAVAALAGTLPPDAVLYVGNSLAVRDLDWFWPPAAPPVRVLANRGANGIDGFVSSTLGAAAAGSVPVVGLCGDLSFYHDLNGLLAARRHGVRAVLLVVNNDGGGIFDHLPVAEAGELYEELFVTPHGLDFRPAVEMYGVGFERVAHAADLPRALERALAAPGAAVVELVVDRAASLAAHRRAWTRARAAVGDAA